MGPHRLVLHLLLIMASLAFTSTISTPSLQNKTSTRSDLELRRPRLRMPVSVSRMSAAPAEGMMTSDWRAFRAHLLKTHRLQRVAHHHASALFGHNESDNKKEVWAHPVPQVEIGACLVANRNHEWPDSFAHLRRAVAVVTDVRPAGVSGLLLNRPTRFTVATHASVLARVGAEFRWNRVMLGGDCSTGSLNVLHPFTHDKCPGATHIVPGLSRGGFNAARTLIRDGGAHPSDFRFFVAYAKWTHDALVAELDRGAWNIVACSSSLMLTPGASDPDYLWNTLNAFL